MVPGSDDSRERAEQLELEEFIHQEELELKDASWEPGVAVGRASEGQSLFKQIRLSELDKIRNRPESGPLHQS